MLGSLSHGGGSLGEDVEVDGVELVLEALQWLQEEVPVGARRREAQRVVETERCRLGEACGAAERRVVVVFAAAGGGGFPAADLSLGAGEVGRGGGCHEASRPGGELQGHRAGEAVQPGDGVEPRGRPGRPTLSASVTAMPGRSNGSSATLRPCSLPVAASMALAPEGEW